jgi:hypothetical protein
MQQECSALASVGEGGSWQYLEGDVAGVRRYELHFDRLEVALELLAPLLALVELPPQRGRVGASQLLAELRDPRLGLGPTRLEGPLT